MSIEWLNKLVSIVSQFIIQSVKLPKQVCRNKSIDAMRNTAEAPLNIGPNIGPSFLQLQQIDNI